MSFAIIYIYVCLCTFDIIKTENVITDVKLVYYKGKSVSDTTKYIISDFVKMYNGNRGFRSRNKTVIYIHGYEESSSSQTAKKIVQAYLKARPDTNVIVVDWSSMSDKAYLNNAASNTEKVGRAVAIYLLEAISKGLKKHNLHIIGHSLGCHVAASVARTTQIYGLTLPRVTGLDCAFPGFFPAVISRRLSLFQAEFVDAIHTDSGMYGQPVSFAHVDFWPNGGTRKQPGCANVNIFKTVGSQSIKQEFCSHRRSCEYYAESVVKPGSFLALKCSDYEYFKKNRCDNTPVANMGYGATKELRGNYYLLTNDKSPYGKGKDGIKGPK